MKDWVSLGLQAAIAAAVGWVCWKLYKLRRRYRAEMAAIMAEEESWFAPHDQQAD
jgi:hypothetical protein